MRLFAFILSLFILGLSVAPCTDHLEEEKLKTESGYAHADHDHEEDTCTPLCSCSCCGCGGYVLSSPVFYTALKEVKTFSINITSYRSDFISSYFYSFWQPPKLG